jgi:16S rRNA (guanine527-N7)-methyltransferase
VDDLKSRLEQVVERWRLPDGSSERLERLLRALAEDPYAPTSVRDPVRGADVHVADSLSALEVTGLREADPVVDIGSGAGFPGLVLASALPEAHIDLVESARRKCQFLERVVGELGLENVAVVCSRAEEWAAAGGRERYSLVVARAVGLLATLVEYAAPLLRVGGQLVAWKGRRDSDEERRGEAAASLLGMRPLGVRWVGPYAGSRHRHLHVYEKLTPCPAGYPRRVGMAKKRPLG